MSSSPTRTRAPQSACSTSVERPRTARVVEGTDARLAEVLARSAAGGSLRDDALGGPGGVCTVMPRGRSSRPEHRWNGSPHRSSRRESVDGWASGWLPTRPPNWSPGPGSRRAAARTRCRRRPAGRRAARRSGGHPGAGTRVRRPQQHLAGGPRQRPPMDRKATHHDRAGGGRAGLAEGHPSRRSPWACSVVAHRGDSCPPLASASGESARVASSPVPRPGRRRRRRCNARRVVASACGGGRRGEPAPDGGAPIARAHAPLGGQVRDDQ